MESFNSYMDQDRYDHDRQISVGASYYQNPSLTRQYSANLFYNYHWLRDDSPSEEYAYLRATLGHLWNVADRINWNLTLSHNGRRAFDPRRDNASSALVSDFDFRIEDRLTLGCGVDLRYSHTERDDAVGFGWNLVYNVGLTYDLGAGILN